MKVSVLMCFFNDEKYLRASVKSIINQTYNNFELVLVDDCSTDSSKKTIDDLIKYEKNIKYFKNNKNYGLTKSLNIGLKLCNGDIIVRSDSDDFSNINRLEKLVKEFINNPNIDFVFSIVNHIDQNKNFIKKSIYFNEYFSFFLLKYFNVFTHGSSAFRYNSEIKYDEEMILSQDYSLWLKEIKKNNFTIINEPLYNLRLHENSISNEKKINQIYYAIYAQIKYKYDLNYDFDFIKKNLVSDDLISKLFFVQILIRKDYELFSLHKKNFNIFQKFIFYLVLLLRK